MPAPNITSNQIAIDPTIGIFYYRDGNDSLVSASLSLLHTSDTLVTSEDSITISGDMTINGNLIVNGNTVTINTETMTVEDSILILNSNVTGAPTADAGIEIERGDENNVLIHWNETSDKWEFTNNGTDYYEISAANVDTTGSAAKWTNPRTITLSGDLSGNVSIDGSADVTLSATAIRADEWTSSRKITLAGDLEGNVLIKGNSDVTLTATIASNSIVLGSDTTGDYAAGVLPGSGITITGNDGEGMTPVISISSSYTTDMVANISNSAAAVSGFALGYANTAYANAVTYVDSRDLNNVSDVTITANTLISGNFLKYNGSAWVNDSIDLNKLSDVVISSVDNGQFLRFDGTTSSWINQGLTEIPAGTAVSTIIGNDIYRTYTINHGLGTQEIFVTVLNAESPYEVIYARWEATDDDNITIYFEEVVPLNSIKVMCYGSVSSQNINIIVAALNQISDVDINTPNSGETLIYNGAYWVNDTPSLQFLKDVDTAGATPNQLLKFDGTNWVNSTLTDAQIIAGVGGDGTSGQAIVTDGAGLLTFSTIVGTTEASIVSAVGADGTSGQVLKTNGAGDLSFGDVAQAQVTNLSTSLGLKADLADPTFTGTVSGVTATMVGLGNVDNTTDAGKLVSTAGQTALDLKANIAGPTFTGTVSGITKTMVGLGNADNTADDAKPVSTAGQTALDLKANLASPTFSGTVTVPSPVNSTDAATKAYADVIQQGLVVKDSSRVTSTGNLTLSGTQTIDGVSVIAGDRVLAKNQTTGSQNGIYTVAVGSWSRSTDADTDSEVIMGMFTFVTEGSVNANSGWILTTSGVITLNTTSLTFVQFSSAGQTTAGAGLTKTGDTINAIGTANRIVINSNDIDIGSDVVTLTSSQTLTNKTLTSPVVNTPTGIVKGDVGLGNVDNTTDAGKPVSTAGQTALDLKANLAGPTTFTGTITLPSNTITTAMLADGAAKAGFRSALNEQTGTSYTLVLSDLAKLIIMDDSVDRTLTVPPNSSVAFTVGDRVDILGKGAGALTIVAGSGVTVNATPGLLLRAQWSSATLVKLATNGWVLIGDLKA